MSIESLLSLDASPSGATHPGLHALRRLRAGELDAAARRDLDDHVAACANCRARLDAVDADAAAFQQRYPFERLAGARGERRAPGLLGRLTRALFGPAGLTALAAAAAAVVVILLVVPGGGPVPAVEPPAPTTRLKSAVDLSFHVKRGATVIDGQPGGVYFPGDRVQLRYSTPRHPHLVVVSLDSAGAVTAFYDHAGRSLGTEPGAGRLLDGSIELDDTLGAERIVGCFSAEPIDTAAVLAAGRRALDAALGDPAAVSRLDLPCEQATFLIRKAAHREASD